MICTFLLFGIVICKFRESHLSPSDAILWDVLPAGDCSGTAFLDRFWGNIGWGAKLATHFLLVPRSRMRWNFLSWPLYSLEARWTYTRHITSHFRRSKNFAILHMLLVCLQLT